MHTPTLIFKKDGFAEFQIVEGNEVIAFLEVSVEGKKITAYHTEVSPLWEGKGLGKQLFNQLIEYTRSHQYRLIPKCPYVAAQINRDLSAYSDVMYD